MKKILLSFLFLFCGGVALLGQSWDRITSSGEFYYGEGRGDTKEQATDRALSDMIKSIAIKVESEFSSISEQTSSDGEYDHQARVIDCINTYAHSSLTDVEKWVVSEPPSSSVYHVRCWIKKSELYRIYEGRIAKAKDLMNYAEMGRQAGKLDMALQYYYWAYSLIRSVQHPNEVKDESGKTLMTVIPVKIREILQGLTIKVDAIDGDYVDLIFLYNGEPVKSLDFNYNDGRAVCQGIVKDGLGMMEMIPGHKPQFYHLDIEYEYKGQARGESEVESVLRVITKKYFDEANFSVSSSGRASSSVAAGGNPKGSSKETTNKKKGAVTAQSNDYKSPQSADALEYKLNASDNQLVADTYRQKYIDVMDTVLSAIRTKRYGQVMSFFTFEGLEVFNELIAYGTARIVGDGKVNFFQGASGRVSARGLQMSFSFNVGRNGKKTFVEDVVFTFNEDCKIENVSFGLGEQSTNDILCREAPGWNNATREVLTTFLENYKTAYSLKRLDYIKTIYSDSAVIIVGNVVRPKPANTSSSEMSISANGQNIISYNRYDKDSYLANLKRVFANNEFINIRFTNNEIQWLEKFEDRKVFAINIGQEYSSSRYADSGYLFLLVDMTNEDEPLIYVRTWQPNQVNLEELYSAGDFFGF